MRTRIFRGMCAVALLSVLLTCLCVTGVLYRASFENMKRSIRDEAVYIAAALNAGEHSVLEATRATFTRVTVVAPDGTVQFDSMEDPARMENHANRPEIEGALRTGAAEVERLSSTLDTHTYYRAVRLSDGRVARISGSMDSALTTAFGSLPFLILSCAAVMLLSGFLARIQTRRIAAPLNAIDLEHPLENEAYEELAPLFRRMEQQRGKIEEQLEQLSVRQQELTAITGSMREGLILLNAQAAVLSINSSALEALGLSEEDCFGKHILNVSRDETFQNAVKQGLSGTQGEAMLRLGESQYRLLISPVVRDGLPGGTALLLLDVTDKFRAEQLRKEFSANVSHELKTPLTSISGYAEIMKNGMVKPEDMRDFARRIHSEAGRLITLVEDILYLSRMDEGGVSPAREDIALLPLAKEIAERMQQQAAAKHVTVEVSGEERVVYGARAILEEMISNLCDNAIKYNLDGGQVEIRVDAQGDQTVLSVRDTGIGIPGEHHERVFERFYRVDKSHSKETGGTGLGLSIVKHGALYHHATLSLSSEVSKGTEIRVTFPAGLR